MVRAAAAPGANPGPPNSAPPPPRPPDPPSPKITCETCGFNFIVGSIALAKCPNCGAEVKTGIESEEE
jgi:DNA-directed RNA polymerase subunit RPC12/RpoP